MPPRGRVSWGPPGVKGVRGVTEVHDGRVQVTAAAHEGRPSFPPETAKRHCVKDRSGRPRLCETDRPFGCRATTGGTAPEEARSAVPQPPRRPRAFAPFPAAPERAVGVRQADGAWPPSRPATAPTRSPAPSLRPLPCPRGMAHRR